MTDEKSNTEASTLIVTGNAEVGEPEIVKKAEYVNDDGYDIDTLRRENKNLKNRNKALETELSARDKEDAGVMRDRIAKISSWWEKPISTEEMKEWTINNLLDCHEWAKRVGDNPMMAIVDESTQALEERRRGVRYFPKIPLRDAVMKRVDTSRRTFKITGA